MPYIRKGKCVHKQNPDGSAGASVGCSDSVEEAKAHLKALYANVPDVSKEAGDVSSTTYVHGPGGVLSQPGQTKPKKKKKVINAMLTPKEFSTTFKLKDKDWMYAGQEAWLVSSAISALAALNEIAREEAYSNESTDVAEVSRMMRDLMAFISDQLDEMDEAMTTTSDMMMYKEVKSQFITTKDADGKVRWTMFTGSAFEDKDQEIISEKALQDDCDQMELTGDYGELLWWHSDGEMHITDKEARPYLPLGKCDISFVDNKINIESGTYYDDKVGAVLNEHSKEFGASKSFWHKEEEPVDGVYTYIRTKERSLLPRTKEANLLTRLFGQKEKEMADNKERIAALKEKLGEEKTNEILAQGKEMSEKADKFLASKEAKTPKKKKADDKEDAADEGKDEESESMKEFTETLTAMKESSDKLLLTLKEQSDAFTVYKEAKDKELDEVKANMAQVQSGLATLLGFQPKGGNKFVASESKDTVKKELTAEEKQKEKESLGFGGDVTSWIISGERPVAA